MEPRSLTSDAFGIAAFDPGVAAIGALWHSTQGDHRPRIPTSARIVHRSGARSRGSLARLSHRELRTGALLSGALPDAP
eukprot:8362170-Alexandrium_andersonii.AAC.1